MDANFLPCGHHNSLLVKSVESDYQFCELCECRKMRNDAEEMERAYKKRAEEAERRAEALREEIAQEESDDSKGDWQCRDYADGWITFPDRKAAEKYQEETGAVMRYRRLYTARKGEGA